MTRIERLANDLMLIDTGYCRAPAAIGVYLLSGDRPALVETGPASTVDAVLEGVRTAGIEPRDLRAVAVTHIHLDHAGAAGTLLRRLPHLDVYVHPVGAPHLVDPSRLITSARRLYGDDLDTLLGEPEPIPGDRVHLLEDGTQIMLGSRRLRSLDTPGHARHHLALLDESSGDLFTGDAAGICLPGARYVLPPTPPPELDVPTWDATLGRLRALRPQRLLLTHFGPHAWCDELLAQVQQRLPAAVDLVRSALGAGMDEEAIVERLRDAGASAAAEDGPDAAGRLEVVMPSRLNALGLIRYVRTAASR
ncbi:MAG: MBL fold metallo-hydrolase [Armatimonadetes bacterium]|nr:MBL fold metallo-hydrolase [Armatimonadota bacterium]